ncbi:MAG: UpxY family transcription antiterminator [Acidobacteria bacterium]|nr:UpxY family transcription antiterminator [Acidobacteriota bacterium]
MASPAILRYPGDVKTDNSQWYAFYTQSRHEKVVAAQLEQRRLEAFLPLYRSWRRWKDRRKLIELALFPNYVFVKVAIGDRLRVLQLPGVISLVAFNGQPAPLPEQEMNALRKGLKNDIYAEPHPYLRIGKKVKVIAGPMAGVEGILVRKKDRYRVVVSIDVLTRSVAVEVDGADLELSGR